MPNEVDSFLEGINEGNDDFAEPESKDPFNQETVITDKGDEDVEEKPLPFNKDPKIQKFIEKEISRKLAEQKPTETERFVKEAVVSKEEQDEILASLTEIVGNDTPQKVSAVNRLRKALAGSEERAVEKAIQSLENISQQEAEQVSQEEAQAEEELDNGFEAIEETFGVDLYSPANKKIKNDFLDFVVRLAPKDRNGDVTEYPDFQETFKLFRGTQKNNNRAKELSSRSMDRSSNVSTGKKGGSNWSEVEKLFSELDK